MKTDIQLRLYKVLLIAGACLSIISILGNLIAGFPLMVNVKWGVLFIVCAIAYVLSNNRKLLNNLTFGVFIFLVCFLMPFAFVDSGGSSNNSISYIFLLLIAITLLMNGWRRILLVVLLIVQFVLMHILEYLYPEIIFVYSESSQFVDRLIQIPLVLIAAFIIILRFSKEYERIYQKLHMTANVDELTGLYNRRLFNKAMKENVENRNGPINLILLDLDNFKKVNDRFGHSIGDQVLKELSALLQKYFGGGKHIVCRWGGDEFAIIYYGDKDELAEKLEELKQAFKSYVSVYEETTGITTSIITVSDYDKASQVIVAADHMLYKEKLKKDAKEYLCPDFLNQECQEQECPEED